MGTYSAPHTLYIAAFKVLGVETWVWKRKIYKMEGTGEGETRKGRDEREEKAG